MAHPISVGGINDLVIADCIGEVDKRGLRSISVLDLGTAEGYNINTLNDALTSRGVATEFLGVDIDNAEYVPPKGAHVKLLAHDLNKDFKVGSFDFVIATEVIEHVENPYHFIRNCLSNLKPDGIAYISSPNVASLYSAMRIALIKAPAFFEDDSSLVHISPVSAMTIKKALALIEKETRQKWAFEQRFTKNVIKLPTFIPVVNRRSINLSIPGNSRLFSQVSYYKIRRAK